MHVNIFPGNCFIHLLSSKPVQALITEWGVSLAFLDVSNVRPFTMASSCEIQSRKSHKKCGSHCGGLCLHSTMCFNVHVLFYCRKTWKICFGAYIFFVVIVFKGGGKLYNYYYYYYSLQSYYHAPLQKDGPSNSPCLCRIYKFLCDLFYRHFAVILHLFTEATSHSYL